VVASAGMVLNELWRNRATAGVGLAIIAAGIPVYRWTRRSRAPTT